MYVALSILCAGTLVGQWTPAGLEGESIRAIAAGQNALFAVTADSNDLYRSVDEGATWSLIMRREARDIAVSPTGTLFKTTVDAVYRSTDNGQSWSRSLITGSNSLIDISPGGVIFLNIVFPHPGGHTHALTVSTDDGVTWESRHGSDSTLCLGGESMAFSGPYAILADVCPDHQGFFVSSDAGVTWTGLRASACAPMFVGSTSGGIFAACQDGIDVSTDICSTWNCIGATIPTAFLTLPFRGLLAATANQGVLHLSDRGDFIEATGEGIAGRIVHALALDSGRHVYAGTDSGIFRTEYFDVRLSSTHFDLGDIILQVPHQEDLLIFNTGAEPLTFDSVSIDDPDVSIQGLCDTLLPGDSCPLSLICNPFTVGDKSWHVLFALSGNRMNREVTVTASVYALTEQSLSRRWNLISLPLHPRDPRAGTNYPGALSPAYDYNGDYFERDSLLSGKGYWMKFSDDTGYIVMGRPIEIDTIPVSEGWNLIGSLTSPVAVGNIRSDPPGMITSRFFGYEGAYRSTDTIYPGKGHWVRAYSPGFLILSPVLPPAGPCSVILISNDGSSPPPPPGDELSAGNDVPHSARLEQNYPNPFNPSTLIGYSLPVSGYVTLKIYSMLGQEVVTLVAENNDAGMHVVQFDASQLPSGVYYYRMVAGSFAETRKLMIVK
jgi:hypothetical protein